MLYCTEACEIWAEHVSAPCIGILRLSALNANASVSNTTDHDDCSDYMIWIERQMLDSSISDASKAARASHERSIPHLGKIAPSRRSIGLARRSLANQKTPS